MTNEEFEDFTSEWRAAVLIAFTPDGRAVYHRKGNGLEVQALSALIAEYNAVYVRRYCEGWYDTNEAIRPTKTGPGVAVNLVEIKPEEGAGE